VLHAQGVIEPMPQTTAADVRARPRRAVDFEPLPIAPDGPARPLVPLKPEGSGTPVFFIHQGYGEVFQYKRVAERLREDIRLYGVEAQGLRDGLEPRTSLPEMATAYLNAIRHIQPEGPYLIAGFSSGGHVAWEMGRQLDANGEEARLLIIDDGPPNRDRRPMNIVRKAGRVAAYHWRNWRGLEGPARRAYRVATIRDEAYKLGPRLGLDPTGRLFQLTLRWGRKRQARGYLPVLRAMNKATADWTFEPYRRPVTLFRAELQPPNRPESPTLRFTPEMTAGGIEVYPIPGSHAVVFTEPHVNELTVQFERWFDRHRPDGPAPTPIKSARPALP
jgi:thioesterase domain-containing protein